MHIIYYISCLPSKNSCACWDKVDEGDGWTVLAQDILSMKESWQLEQVFLLDRTGVHDGDRICVCVCVGKYDEERLSNKCCLPVWLSK